MRYGVEITQRTESGEKIVVVDANGDVCSECVFLRYRFDGAEYELEYDGEILRQTRKGDISLIMKFIHGEETICRIISGEGEGVFSVYTELLEVRCSGDTTIFNCKYYTDDEDDPITLEIRVYPLDEDEIQ